MNDSNTAALIMYNEVCVECQRCEEKMIKIGPITLCHICFMDLIVGNDLYREKDQQVATNSKMYSRLLLKHKLLLDKEEDKS